MDHCLRHMEEAATGECRSCHGTFCARCLVYSFGPKKPPFCVGCALVASGVRNGARRSYEPRTSAPAEVGGFASAPALFSDDTQGHGPGQPPMSSGPGAAVQSAGVKSSWSHRRTQRQAAKAARRAAQDAAAAAAVPQPGGPIEAQNLEPVLSQHQRKALGRLSASSF